MIGASRRHIYEPYPTLRTERLLLWEFSPEDAPDVRTLAGVRKLARTTRPIPHPYPEGEAERWISTHRAAFEAGEVLHFAVQTREGGELVGGITLAITPGDARAHLTYWIGVPYWGRATPLKPPGRPSVTRLRTWGSSASTQRTSGATPPLAR